MTICGMMSITGKTENITNSQNNVGKKSFGGTFTFSNGHIIGLDNGSLMLIVYVHAYDRCRPLT
jgi:hypothetical protein